MNSRERFFRISHLGYYDELDMLTVIGALERAIKAIGLPLTPGTGVTAVQQAFLGK